MKIEQLPSGNYRIRKMYKGKMYSIVTDYKPTQKEAMQLITEQMNSECDTKVSKTFNGAAKEYIEMKRNTLSSTMSPKIVSDLHGFVHAVLRTFRPNFVLNTTLPKKNQA